MELLSVSVKLLRVKHHRFAGEICLVVEEGVEIVLPTPPELLELSVVIITHNDKTSLYAFRI